MKDPIAHLAAFADELQTTLLDALNSAAFEHMLKELIDLRRRSGRLFVLGMGGGAANAAHAVNDFRKLCGIETYAPTDGISELTARANDEGLSTIFKGWLRTSRISHNDALLVFSVGGGQPHASMCIYEAVQLAKQVGARVLAVVGREDGASARQGDAVVIARSRGDWCTPVTETAQIAVLHALVSHPSLKAADTKW